MAERRTVASVLAEDADCRDNVPRVGSDETSKPRTAGPVNAGSIARRSALALVAAVSLVTVGAGTAEAAFPGKNGRIAFTQRLLVSADSDPESFYNAIQTASPTGRDRRSLTTCPDRRCNYSGPGVPAWSPSGRSLAFSFSFPRRRIGVVRADGSAYHLLPRLTEYDVEPAWSPHGRAFAFAGQAKSSFTVPGTIYTVRTDGSRLRQATPPADFYPQSDWREYFDALQPAWSSTGKIAFMRPVPPAWPRHEVIYSMNPNGSALQRLTDGREPDWSPHGRYLTFTGPGGYVSISRADGTDPRRLIRGREPAWSPDGKRIAFARKHDLFVVRTNGSGLRRIANGHGWRRDKQGRDRELFYDEPSWQPVR